MKNFSPLCSIVMLENLKTSTVNFIISHPGLSYIFVQEVNQFSFRVLLITFTRTVISHDLCGMLPWKIQNVMHVYSKKSIERYIIKNVSSPLLP